MYFKHIEYNSWQQSIVLVSYLILGLGAYWMVIMKHIPKTMHAAKYHATGWCDAKCLPVEDIVLLVLCDIF